MSDPVIESQEIKETQEFPSIQNVEGGEEDERGEGSEGDDEKRWKMVRNVDKLWEKWNTVGNNVFTTNILTSRKGITNIKKGITNIKGRVTGDATDISGKHWQQTLANNGVRLTLVPYD